MTANRLSLSPLGFHAGMEKAIFQLFVKPLERELKRSLGYMLDGPGGIVWPVLFQLDDAWNKSFCIAVEGSQAWQEILQRLKRDSGLECWLLFQDDGVLRLGVDWKPRLRALRPAGVYSPKVLHALMGMTWREMEPHLAARASDFLRHLLEILAHGEVRADSSDPSTTYVYVGDVLVPHSYSPGGGLGHLARIPGVGWKTLLHLRQRLMAYARKNLGGEVSLEDEAGFFSDWRRPGR